MAPAGFADTACPADVVNPPEVCIAVVSLPFDADTYIQKNENNNFGNAPDLSIGVLTSSADDYRTLLHADLSSIPALPQMVCQFDCAGRGKAIVGDDVYKGIEMAQLEFEDTVPWMGLFTFGEISPIEKDNHFHNFTATLAVFY